MKKLCLSIACFFLLLFANCAQTPDEIKSLKIQYLPTSKSIYIDSSRINNSEFDFIVGLLFRFYKKHISSQDFGSCSFQPSCSEYALLAIKKQGFFMGTINVFDRLTRCSKNTSNYYPIKTKNGLNSDPVRNIFYEEK
jgi:putative component of membrane protein insertase Oxa1/YidC/SpoIIIJ protein YidD